MYSPNGGTVPSYDNRCQRLTLGEALSAFASSGQPTQSQRHIKPLHWLNANPPNSAGLLGWSPEPSDLRFGTFFDRLYREYDLRYVYAAPKLEKATRRLFWAEDSPALDHPVAEEFEARLAP